jgi:hypothetical protein
MRLACGLAVMLLLDPIATLSTAEDEPLVSSGTKLVKVWGDGSFTKGPAYGPGGRFFAN